MEELQALQLGKGQKVYFASDFHLGSPDYNSSLVREKKVVRWLDTIKADACELFLIGDVFDFWFEYGHVSPNGYSRLLGKLAELSDSGIKIHWFTGNHDMWIFNYLPEEIGFTLYRQPVIRTMNDRVFFIGHGDGLGPGDRGYKFIKKVFANKLCQWMFKWIHPEVGMAMGEFWSRKSRKSTHTEKEKFLGEENEWLVIYAREQLKLKHFDYFIFGHRHLPLDLKVAEKSRYINLGDWISHFTYAEFDGGLLSLKKFEG